jgi:hypothetical protein
MDTPSFEETDEDLFPVCDAERVGTRHTDEYGVTYICDHVERLGYSWVHLQGPAEGAGT